MIEDHEFSGWPVIIGAGLAGIKTALCMAPEPVVPKGQLEENSSSILAQGGITATIGDDDRPELHFSDTIAAGDGLCEAEVVERITKAGATTIGALSRYGAQFDKGRDGRYVLGLEAVLMPLDWIIIIVEHDGNVVL